MDSINLTTGKFNYVLMFNNKLGAFLACILISSFALSCSTTSKTASNEGEAKTAETASKYPSWYESSRSIQSDEDTYFGYATALAADSSLAAEKAVRQAKVELKTAISNRLEAIRNDALVEMGSESGLDNTRFIIALRKAEDEVASVAEMAEVSVESNDGNGYRGFSKVTVDKEALIEALDREFSANAKAWNAMKESDAFSQF